MIFLFDLLLFERKKKKKITQQVATDSGGVVCSLMGVALHGTVIMLWITESS